MASFVVNYYNIWLENLKACGWLTSCLLYYLTPLTYTNKFLIFLTSPSEAEQCTEIDGGEGAAGMQSRANLTCTQRVPGGCSAHTVQLSEGPSLKMQDLGLLPWSDRLNQHSQIWNTSPLEVVRISNWALSAQHPSSCCLAAVGSAVLIEVGKLRHLFDLHIRCGISLWNAATAVVPALSKTGENVTTLLILKDSLMCWRRCRGLEPSGFWFPLLQRGNSSESARLTWVCSKYFSHYFLPYSCPETFIGFELRFLCSVKFFLSFPSPRPPLSFYLFLAPDLKKMREDGGGKEMGQHSVSQLFLFFYKLKLTKEKWICLHLVSICTTTVSPRIKSLFEEVASHFCVYFRTPFFLLFYFHTKLRAL